VDEETAMMVVRVAQEESVRMAVVKRVMNLFMQ